MIAVLWPARFLGPMDGAPLDHRFEAIVLGLALPWLFWLGRDACHSKAFRSVVLALLMWKGVTAAVAVQQGLCTTFRSPEPLSGTAFEVRIDEPRGVLRSWDVRADLWGAQPTCTAIVSRPLRTTEDFPAWFVNITDQMLGRREFLMTVRGVVTSSSGVSQPIDLSVVLGREPWSFDPTVDNASVWSAPLVTTTMPSPLDRLLAPWAWLTAPLLCIGIIGLLLRAAVAPIAHDYLTIGWVVAGSVIAAAVALAPISGLHRAAGAITLGALLPRVGATHSGLSTAAWTVGAPWLAFFAAYSQNMVGRFSAYSMDDWLAYQIAGYRIYMNGKWLEGGTLTFDYQPLYRWITGALHLVFGDSSVGEVYWDASCLLAGALLAFHLTYRAAAFRWAIAAAAFTLATLTVTTPWYIIGRGLSEISAAGFGFLAIACLARANGQELKWITIAAVMAALMFYARLNHLIWAPCLVAMLLPPQATAEFAGVRAAVARVSWKAAAVFLGSFALAVALFMTRTWYFNGRFALFYGTALNKNDTGLRPWQLFDGEVWAKVAHSVSGLVFMNEPPQPDARSLVVVAGAVIAALALLQLPIARKIPAGLLLVTIGGVLAAFLAHSHAYPGRFSVHLVPLASALTAIAASRMISGLTGSDWRVSHSNGRCTPVT